VCIYGVMYFETGDVTVKIKLPGAQGTRHESTGSTHSRPEHQMVATVFRIILRRNKSVQINNEGICGYASESIWTS